MQKKRLSLLLYAAGVLDTACMYRLQCDISGLRCYLSEYLHGPRPSLDGICSEFKQILETALTLHGITAALASKAVRSSQICWILVKPEMSM